VEKTKAVFTYPPTLQKYPYPPDCPFNTARAGRVRELAASMGFLSGPGVLELAAPAAERKTLETFHTARYLDALERAGRGQSEAGWISMGIGTPDCPAFEGVYEGAALATGGTVAGVDMIDSRQARVVFNPCGGFHHAAPGKASGFCYINDVAIACGLFAGRGRRVVYLDVDVHFGDGVAYGFYDRADVLTISFHESPTSLFPGTGFVDETGSGAGKGYCVNVPLPPGTYDEAYLGAFNAIAPPLIEAFGPDVIVFELGADALSGDPLAHLAITNNVYSEVIGRLMALDVPVLSTGGGGYNIDNTVRAWTLAWSLFCGRRPEDAARADGGLAVGGVLLENVDWPGGLRDRVTAVDDHQSRRVEPAVTAVIEWIRANVFPVHGI
jgi:acetoin utilization protein AcuC